MGAARVARGRCVERARRARLLSKHPCGSEFDQVCYGSNGFLYVTKWQTKPVVCKVYLFLVCIVW